ncbi:unnamed protein product, partial [Brassica oleracea]
GGKAKPLKQPKADKKEYDEHDMANLQKKKDEEKALKELRAKASQKGSFGGSGLKEERQEMIRFNHEACIRQCKFINLITDNRVFV